MSEMKYGLAFTNAYALSWPDVILDVALQAETSGMESLWTIEHIAMPSPSLPGAPMAADARVLEPLVVLAFVASHTRSIRLGTGITVLPFRNPLVYAKQVATLDILSKGRTILGIGVGYYKPEFEALGVPFVDRGRRSDEYLAAMREIWYSSAPSYEGRFVKFSGVESNPRPVQGPPFAVVVGGSSNSAYRRAWTTAGGWYGYGLSFEEARERISALRTVAADSKRPGNTGDFQITITPDRFPDEALVEQYRSLGVERLNLSPPRDMSSRGLSRFFDRVASMVERE